MKFYGFLLLWSLLSLSLTTNPGIKMRITNKALIDGQEFGIEYLKQKLKEAVFEDWNGQDQYSLFSFSYIVSGLKVDNIEVPLSSVFFMSETGVHILLDLKTTLSLDWKINTWFGSGSGRANITISMDFRAVVNMTRHETGYQSWLLKYCEANIKDKDIQLGEGYGFSNWVIAIVLRKFLHYQLNNNALCPCIKEKVQRLSMKLIDNPVLVQIDPFVQIDSSLTDSPIFYDDYMDLDLKGTVYPIGNITERSFEPAPFMLPDVHDSMLYIGVSEYSFQSALLAYYSSGVFNISLAKALSSFIELGTDTLSPFIPVIYKLFPEPYPVMLNLVVTAPPVVTLSPERFNLQFAGSMEALAVIPNSNTPSLLFTLNITANIHAESIISKQKLVPELFLDSFHFSLANSHVGYFNVEPLESVVRNALQIGIIPETNAFMKNGFPLPNLDKFILVDTALQVHPGYVVISTDFKL